MKFMCHAIHTIVLFCWLLVAVANTDSNTDDSRQSSSIPQEADVIQALLSGPFLHTEIENSGHKESETRKYSCSPNEETSSSSDTYFRGTSLGGWLVLEPWITPSLFYQFLGVKKRYSKSKGHVAFDSYTFCEVLGHEEANRQLKIHWKHWVTEQQIQNLAALGLNTIRIPIADWMYVSYYPFDSGCWEGALDELDRVLDLCHKYHLNVMLDLHAVRGSQNGLDNSGDTRHYEWVNDSSYRHWDIRGGDWAGQYDPVLRRYVTINETQLLDTLTAIQRIAMRYADHPAVIGLQPVNEPWDMIPWPVMREFYWRSYRLIRNLAPRWKVIFHDSFRLGTPTESVWLAPNAGIVPSVSDEVGFATNNNGNSSKLWPVEEAANFNNPERSENTRFLAHCKHYIVDIHVYQAWAWNPYDTEYFVRTTCEMGERLRAMEEAGIPLIVGEWSLATDNCAMWLNGLNDNVPGYPKAECQRVPCPNPYFPVSTDHTETIPNAPPNISEGRQDPYGQGGDSYVEYGTCPVDHTHGLYSSADTADVLDYTTSTNQTALLSYFRRNIVAAFAAAQWSAFNLHTHGQLFWNFRTELEETWDIQQASSALFGWLPRNMSVDSAESQQMMQYGCMGYSDVDHDEYHNSIEKNKKDEENRNANNNDKNEEDVKETSYPVIPTSSTLSPPTLLVYFTCTTFSFLFLFIVLWLILRPAFTGSSSTPFFSSSLPSHLTIKRKDYQPIASQERRGDDIELSSTHFDGQYSSYQQAN